MLANFVLGLYIPQVLIGGEECPGPNFVFMHDLIIKLSQLLSLSVVGARADVLFI
jgi:hypothetical protein